MLKYSAMSDPNVNEETPIACATSSSDSGSKSKKQCIIISVLLLIFLAVIAAGVLAYVFIRDQDKEEVIEMTGPDALTDEEPPAEKTTFSCAALPFKTLVTNQECMNYVYNEKYQCGCSYKCGSTRDIRVAKDKCKKNDEKAPCCVVLFCAGAIKKGNC
ncbi:hypothetical protein ACHWQZ_G008341 [Mnemiopsis leidyi]